MKDLFKYLIAAIAIIGTSCSDFLDTVPHDALSPATTWKTEDDAQKFLIGCYDGWASSDAILYLDCASDFGYNNFFWEGWTYIGNGKMTASNSNYSFYDFSHIRRCNTFLNNVDNIKFASEEVKNDMKAQARLIRAYCYFTMNWWYGGVPIIKNYETAEEAKVPRNTEEEVKNYVNKELDEIIPMLNKEPKGRGYLAKGAALALKIRSALYYENYNRVIEAFNELEALKLYKLEPVYSDLFKVKGQGSKEIIAAVQHIVNFKGLYTVGQMYNNQDGGWSSIVPTQKLIDMYEMNDGLTMEEAKTKGTYDEVHPFKDRDPRMAMSILYPGCDWRGRVFNTLDKKIKNNKGEMMDNPDFPTNQNNCSKTALTWRKYTDEDYADMWDTNACPIVFRYGEAILSYAEAENELNGPSAKVYEALNKIRNRVGMPAVDQTKYGTKETLRELIRRERAIELAGEGLRRADILRWKDENGKMLAETVMNGDLMRVTGTIDYDATDPFLKAVIATKMDKIENREFKPYNRYFPIKQGSLDKNPNLKQNPGY